MSQPNDNLDAQALDSLHAIVTRVVEHQQAEPLLHQRESAAPLHHAEQIRAAADPTIAPSQAGHPSP